jgi:AraC-like DNA-binding protein
LNWIENGAGARRIIGHHLKETTDTELVLIGPQLHHSWQKHNCKSKKTRETSLHFHSQLFGEDFLQRHPVKNIKTLLANSAKGISFSRETISKVSPLLNDLKTAAGFDSLILLMRLLNILSVAPATILSPAESGHITSGFFDTRIKEVLGYIHQNIGNEISLKNAATVANMAEVSFSRFFKQRTGKNFIECVIDIRIDYASRLLADTTGSIAEIAFLSGFNNISNFNRIFKNKKNLTPKQYREVFSFENVYKMCS